MCGLLDRLQEMWDPTLLSVGSSQYGLASGAANPPDTGQVIASKKLEYIVVRSGHNVFSTVTLPPPTVTYQIAGEAAERAQAPVVDNWRAGAAVAAASDAPAVDMTWVDGNDDSCAWRGNDRPQRSPEEYGY